MRHRFLALHAAFFSFSLPVLNLSCLYYLSAKRLVTSRTVSSRILGVMHIVLHMPGTASNYLEPAAFMVTSTDNVVIKNGSRSIERDRPPYKGIY
ncbi:hypothetical protein ACQKWADRAFT_285560 [Trichoderma austrokoningii]